MPSANNYEVIYKEKWEEPFKDFNLKSPYLTDCKQFVHKLPDHSQAAEHMKMVQLPEVQLGFDCKMLDHSCMSDHNPAAKKKKGLVEM